MRHGPRSIMQVSSRKPHWFCNGIRWQRFMGSKSASSFLRDLFSLEETSAIVTGGGTGIGFALAQGLAQAGARVVLTGRRESVLQDACTKIRDCLDNDDDCDEQQYSRQASYVTCDLTDYGQLSNLVKEAEFLSGISPTILINNAGVNVRQKINDLTSDHWHDSLNLQLTAPFMLSRTMAANMQQRRHGRIINIASLQSFTAFPDSIPYAAAKAGVLGLTRALAEAFAPVHGYPNVTCNALAPGFVKTELTGSVFANKQRSELLASATLLGRNSAPDDLVGAAIFLASPASAYVTGQVLPVDGGFTALGMR